MIRLSICQTDHTSIARELSAFQHDTEGSNPGLQHFTYLGQQTPCHPISDDQSGMQWGAVERQPGKYDWSGYQELFAMVKAKGLRIQAVMSFHACGGNVGDYAQVPLPEWVLKA